MDMTNSIQFTDYTAPENTLKLNRQVFFDHIPVNWHTIVVTDNETNKPFSYGGSFNVSTAANWIIENTHGRFGIINKQFHGMVFYFEDDQDAILFRLLEGEKAIGENHS